MAPLAAHMQSLCLAACLSACCCLSQSQSSSFQHLDNDLLSQPGQGTAQPELGQTRDGQGTEQEASLWRSASLAILFAKWPFLFASASASAPAWRKSVGCLRLACGQILHVNQFISLELKLNQPQRRSLERQRQQFWQLRPLTSTPTRTSSASSALLIFPSPALPHQFQLLLLTLS